MTGSSRASKRFAVVAWSGGVPLHLSPRGQRTQHLISALESLGDVERIGGEDIPQWLAGSSERTKSPWYRRLAKGVVHSVLIDKYEVAARRSLRRWSPNVDLAVLVGYPYSPLPFAATKLVQQGTPFLVDIGDPWMVTNPHPVGGRLRQWRASYWERKLWTSAFGVVVTTQGQGDALKELFPHLQVLVRPNGYISPEVMAEPSTPAPLATDGHRELRLVHYGSLYGHRVKFAAVLDRLAASGKWEKITLRQHGPDWEGSLKSVSGRVEIDHRAPVSWSEVMAEAHSFDAAVVIGWENPARMPSKAIQYLTLPIPRIAIANTGGPDALASYVEDKPGWVVVEDGDPRAAEIVATHLAKPWSVPDLSAPRGESWDAVEQVLGDFAVNAIGDSNGKVRNHAAVDHRLESYEPAAVD